MSARRRAVWCYRDGKGPHVRLIRRWSAELAQGRHPRADLSGNPKNFGNQLKYADACSVAVIAGGIEFGQGV